MVDSTLRVAVDPELGPATLVIHVAPELSIGDLAVVVAAPIGTVEGTGLIAAVDGAAVQGQPAREQTGLTHAWPRICSKFTMAVNSVAWRRARLHSARCSAPAQLRQSPRSSALC